MNPFSIDGFWKIDPDRRQDRGSGQVTTYTMTPEEIEAKYGPKKERKHPVSGFNSEEVLEIRAREREERLEEDMKETKITKEQLFEECRKGGLSPANIKAIAEKYGIKVSNIYARVSQYNVREILAEEAKNMIKQAVADETKGEKHVKVADKPQKSPSTEGEKPQDKYSKHLQLCLELNQVYHDKNVAYGDAFGRTFQELGIISAVTRMYDKFNRVKALSTGAENKVTDEGLKDTLKDLANYCLMTLIEMEIQETFKVKAG